MTTLTVTLLDHMGDDNSVVDAARVSMDRESSQFTPEQNHKLIKYLAEHNHWSPFAHTSVTVRMSAPIAIHAQVMKHTVGFAHNTVSRRYVNTTPKLFIPEFREAPTGSVKQGSGAVIADKEDQEYLQQAYRLICQFSIQTYEYLIEEGIAPEQARFVLPQGVLTEWISTGSLYAWARFYNLRTDPHAQYEIQQLAQQVGDIMTTLYPVSWKALTEKLHD